jgi:glycine/D-amino acid oxidase-like deaminating enzyme
MADKFLRRRVWRKLESLPDERLYQILDYVEFLEGKYAEELPEQPDRMQKFAEGIQDKLRARRAAPWALKGVMGALSVVDRAVGTAAKTARGLADELEKVGRKQDKDRSEDDSDDRPTKIVVD